MSTPTGRHNTVVLVTSIIVIIAALAALDWFLEKTERAELQNEARQDHAEALRALEKDDANRAVDLLRRAHMLDRRNAAYQLDLVRALAAAGKLPEAGTLMVDMLQRQPNDGRTNLIAARLAKQNGRVADAEAYYHRAIYGHWPADAASNRIAARLELVNFLADNGNERELLAELLPLQEEASDDPAIEKRIAHLFLVANSASRAADAYRALIHEHPTDPDINAGLGEAELRQGQYHAAQVAFLNAFRYKPNDVSIRSRMELSAAMAALDPTLRQLTSSEKYRRSARIVELTSGSLQACAARISAPNDAAQLLSSAATILTGKPPTHVTNEASEANLGLAEKIWRTRVALCGPDTSPQEEPVRLLLERLAQ
jgi:tetratricopeptide (TPR) repeat protein